MMNWIDGETELRRIENGPHKNEAIPGIGTVRFVVKCGGNAARVLSDAAETMQGIARLSMAGWNDDFDWASELPRPFVDRCALERTQEQAETELQRRKRLSRSERASEEKQRQWSLLNWLYWMNPQERLWQWWDAQVIDENHIAVAVAVDSWPFPWGALAWLFRASGALEMEAES